MSPADGAPPFATAAVVGLGLMGGSLARDLAAAGVRVLGHDRDADTLRNAIREGVVAAPLGTDLEGATEADIVVLAVPVDAAVALLPRVAVSASRARLVTDVGSTKASAVAAAEACGLGVRFVGSHPLAGDHRSGWEAARAGLFRGAPVWVCPAAGAGPRARALAEALWRGVGAEPREAPAAEHDRAMAWVSHLPQASATALALALAGAGQRRAALGPGGLDATRLAGSSPEMWAPLALDNAEPLAQALAALEDRLARFRTALELRDRGAVEAFFSQGRDWFGA